MVMGGALFIRLGQLL
ncbi:hypothetical protein ACLB1T_12375 [Escherichia coli]